MWPMPRAPPPPSTSATDVPDRWRPMRRTSAPTPRRTWWHAANSNAARHSAVDGGCADPPRRSSTSSVGVSVSGSLPAHRAQQARQVVWRAVALAQQQHDVGPPGPALGGRIVRIEPDDAPALGFLGRRCRDDVGAERLGELLDEPVSVGGAGGDVDGDDGWAVRLVGGIRGGGEASGQQHGDACGDLRCRHERLEVLRRDADEQRIAGDDGGPRAATSHEQRSLAERDAWAGVRACARRGHRSPRRSGLARRRCRTCRPADPPPRTGACPRRRAATPPPRRADAAPRRRAGRTGSAGGGGQPRPPARRRSPAHAPCAETARFAVVTHARYVVRGATASQRRSACAGAANRTTWNRHSSPACGSWLCSSLLW